MHLRFDEIWMLLGGDMGASLKHLRKFVLPYAASVAHFSGIWAIAVIAAWYDHDRPRL
jgi:hypothetical protein